MKTRLLSLLFLYCLISWAFTGGQTSYWVAINWVNLLEKDFSFKEKWSYSEGIYRNAFGQLSCDGICPSGIDKMKDEQGKIYPDSLHAFYQVVDTSHWCHSLQSEAKAYEWNDIDFITFKQQTDQSVLGETSLNAATHSKLVIKIKKDSMTAWMEYNSITNRDRQVFPMKKGTITIDKIYYNQGIIKAAFDCTFVNTLEVEKELDWKGLIYCKMEQ